MNKRLPLLLLAMFSSILRAQPVYVPQELREAPEYALPGSRYGLIQGATIPHVIISEGDHRDFLRVLMANRPEVDELLTDPELWGLTFDPDDLPQGWRFEWAGHIQCPAAFCLLLRAGPSHWLVTADSEYRVQDIAWLTAMKFGFDERRGRQRMLATMDSVFGWDGDRITQPSNFADTGIFCTDYMPDTIPDVVDLGPDRNFMRQIMPDGRILSRELKSWKDCVESDPIESFGSTKPDG